MSALPETVTVAIVGGGQCGIALARHLQMHTLAGDDPVSYLVLERDHIADGWRHGRWDGMLANGPAWASHFHDRDLGPDPSGRLVDPDEYPTKDHVADYLTEYAAHYGLAVAQETAVTGVAKLEGSDYWRVATDRGPVHARYVVIATGQSQKRRVPDAATDLPETITQMHSVDYRDPSALPDGAVLVVGGGPSGYQIAQELISAGRDVHVAVGGHTRVPRRYRGRDTIWWTGTLLHYEALNIPPGAAGPILLSGLGGGRTADYRDLAAQGATLYGHVVGASGDGSSAVIDFADDLPDVIDRGDTYYTAFIDQIDAHIAAHGWDLPAEPEAHEVGPPPASAPMQLDLTAAGVTSIIWATGFSLDYEWLDLPELLDDRGRIIHKRGISAIPGLLFMGLPQQTRLASNFMWGSWYDGRVLADYIYQQEFFRSVYGERSVT